MSVIMLKFAASDIGPIYKSHFSGIECNSVASAKKPANIVVHAVEPRYTTTSLLGPLFCGPNKSRHILLFENPVNPTTPFIRPNFHGPKVVVLTRVPL